MSNLIKKCTFSHQIWHFLTIFDIFLRLFEPFESFSYDFWQLQNPSSQIKYQYVIWLGRGPATLPTQIAYPMPCLSHRMSKHSHIGQSDIHIHPKSEIWKIPIPRYLSYWPNGPMSYWGPLKAHPVIVITLWQWKRFGEHPYVTHLTM